MVGLIKFGLATTEKSSSTRTMSQVLTPTPDDAADAADAADDARRCIIGIAHAGSLKTTLLPSMAHGGR